MVFGVTVSVLGASLAGIESMVGLFINTLPMRARLDPRAELGPWLAGLQERQLALQPFEPTPLARIQAWSEVPPGTPLFSTLVVFENYPSVPLVPQGGLTLGELRFRERTNYPLTLSVDDLGKGFGLKAQEISPVDPNRVCAIMDRRLQELGRERP